MKQPWLKFYPCDWRGDLSLGPCSLAARGLWMEMLCIMSDATPRGSLVKDGEQYTVKRLAANARAPVREVEKLLAELEAEGVFSREADGTIYSRRMRRDVERDGRDVANGNLGGAPDVRRGKVSKAERVRPFKKSDAPEKAERIFASAGGKCFWCDVALIRDDGGDAADLFHVDHLVPICDGGTNAEDNLVPACAVCNHDRSKVGWPRTSRRNVDPTRTTRRDPTLWGVGVGKNSDSKAQNLEARNQSQIESSHELSLRSERETLRDRFCRAYPDHPHPPALDGIGRELVRAITEGATGDEIVAGAKRYAAEVFGRERRFVQAPVKWLADGSWKPGPVRAVDATVDDGRIWHHRESPKGRAWWAWTFGATGRYPPGDAKGGWRFEGEWPPGYGETATGGERVRETA